MFAALGLGALPGIADAGTNRDAVYMPPGSISGKVTNATAGAAVEGIEVCAYHAPSGEYVSCARTGSGGEYTIGNLAGGSYIVGFYPGYTCNESGACSQENFTPQYYSGKANWSEAQPVAVTAGQTTSGIDAAMRVGGQITGKVTSETGTEGIEGIDVCAFEPSTGRYMGCTASQANGEYTLDRLAGGEYVVEFSPGYSCVEGSCTQQNYVSQYYNGKRTSSEADTVSVAVGKETSGIDAAMKVGGQLSGTVTSKRAGAALQDIEVCALQAVTGEHTGCAYTGSKGEYAIAGLPPAQYKLMFSGSSSCGEMGCAIGYLTQFYSGKATFAEGQTLSVAAGQAVSGLDAEMTEAPRISGTVTDAATSLSLAGIEACAYAAASSVQGSLAECATTAADGSYAINVLEPGSYKVEFTPGYTCAGQPCAMLERLDYLGQYYHGKASWQQADAVTTEAAAPAEKVDAAMEPGAEITGKVTEAPNGGAIGGAQVCAYGAANSEYVECVATKSDGSYAIPGLAAGAYKIEFVAPEACTPSGGEAESYAPEYWHEKTSLEGADAVSVEAGHTVEGIDAELHLSGRIAGTVTGATSGAALGGVQVCAYRASTGAYAQCTYSSGSGAYALQALPAGSYKVRFTPPSQSEYVSQYYRGAASWQAAVAVGVQAGKPSTSIDARLQRGGEITGQVTGVGVGALAGATVCAYPSATTSFSAQCASTDESGAYTLKSLPSGSYDVRFSRGYVGNFAPQLWRQKTSFETAEALDVEAGHVVDGIDAELQVGAQIEGTITSAATGDPIAAATVCPESNSTISLECAQSNSSGEYDIEALPPGSYHVVVFPEEQCGASCTEYAFQYWNGQPSRATAATIALEAGATRGGIDMALRSGGTITGKVTNESGAAVPGVTVCALQSAGGELSICMPADQAGEYTLGHLPAAEYKIGFLPANLSEYALQYYEAASSFASARTVPLADGETKSGIDMTLTHGGAIAGEVTDVEGRKLPEVEVCVSEYGSGWVVLSYSLCATTDAAGGYRLSGLPSGEYAVSFFSGSDALEQLLGVSVEAGRSAIYEAQYWNGKASLAAAEPVIVKAPETREGVDASLHRVSGAPFDVEAPRLTGTPALGETLTCTSGVWGGDPESYGFSWLRDGSAISGASSSTYTLREADEDKGVACEITATNSSGSAEATSGALHVPGRPLDVSPPTIAGTAMEGELLTASEGVWEDGPERYAYQWLRCDAGGKSCTKVAGAQARSYTLTEEDVGHAVEVEVMASNAHGSSSPAISQATATVLAPVPANIAPPAIAGTAEQGATLAEAHGEWTNRPTGYIYRWLQCDALGSTCMAIPGATDQSYTLVGANVGSTIEVQETAVNDSGESAPAVSAPTAAVLAAPPVNVSPPTISGEAVEGVQLAEANGAWTNEPSAYSYQWLRCQADGEACTPIVGANSQAYELAEADIGHTLEVEEGAENAGGASAAPALSPPTGLIASFDAQIETGPSGDTNQAGPFTFSADEHATFECAVDRAPFLPCADPFTPSGLADGPHLLSVRAINALGDLHSPPATREFTLDTVPPETTITQAPTAPLHSGPVEFAYEANEPSTFQCALDGGAFTGCEGFQLLADTLPAGEHRFRVRAVDLAGNVDATPAEATFTIENEPPTATLEMTPDAGPASLTTAATVSASDPDGDPLHYEIQFGDGSSEAGELPAQAIAHTYAEEGIYEARLTVGDGHEDVVSTRTVTVTHPEPLHADAGDDQTVVVGEPVAFDGSNSRPLQGIATYNWSFGDGQSAEGATAEHTYQAPGEYKAKLTVTGHGESDSATRTITVLPRPGGNGLTETVQSGGLPLSGAEVLVVLADGSKIQALTDESGVAHLYGIPDGSYEVYAAKLPGYQPGTGAATVSNGEGIGTVELQEGPVASAEMTDRRMTLAEIEEAGIDTSEPANRHVFEFTLNLTLQEGVGAAGSLKGYLGSDGFIPVDGSSCGGTNCDWGVGGATIDTSVGYVGETPVMTSLVIPMRAGLLKEFYAVSMIVNNLGSEPFTFSSGHATISLPDGLSLAPTAHPQSATVALPDIPAGGSASAEWVIRGDSEGEYNLSAAYAGTLEPLGHPVSIDAHTSSPIHIWGAGALKLTAEVDKEARDGYPFAVSVGLTNVADVPVYDPTVELLQNAGQGYIAQPRQQDDFGEREIQPGETYWAGPFILVPEGSGEVDLAKSFVKKIGGDSSIQSTIVTHERKPSFAETPQVRGHRRNDNTITLEWEPVAGATGYEIYRTPDGKTEFPGEPDHSVIKLGETKAVITDAPESPEDYFAISSIIGGRPTMVHPLIGSTAVLPGHYPSIEVADETECGSLDVHTTVTVQDPDFPLKSLTGTVAGTQVSQTPSGSKWSVDVDGKRDEGKLAGYQLTATSKGSGSPDESGGADGQLGQCGAAGLGDSFSAGEGNPPFEPGTGGEAGENHCHRSISDAYLRDLADQKGREDLYIDDFVACSGAETKDFENKNSKNPDEKAQIATVPKDADLVTFSVGGNDLGFSNVLEGCIADQALNILGKVTRLGGLPPCELVAAPYVESHLPELRTHLKTVYEKILDTVNARGRHPRPRVIVMGYPEIFPTGAPLAESPTCDLIQDDDIAWMHQMIEQVNGEIEQVALEAGVEFVNPNEGGLFEGHDVCSGQSYFNGIESALNGRALVESFHPNASGQAALARALAAKLLRVRPTPFTVAQGEHVTSKLLVKAGEALLHVGIDWPGSDMELRLISPSGEVIDRAHVPAGVTHVLGETYESYSIPSAEAGEWTVETVGLEVQPGGEPVTLQTIQTPPVSYPPVALFTSSAEEGTAPLSVKFDGGESIDPQGLALAYEWNYGDGTSGTGQIGEHTYTKPGTFHPTLTARDASGMQDTFEGSSITVNTPAPGKGSGAGRETSGGGTGSTSSAGDGGLAANPLPGALDFAPAAAAPAEVGKPRVNRRTGEITFRFDFPEAGRVSVESLFKSGASIARAFAQLAPARKIKASKCAHRAKHRKCAGARGVLYGKATLTVRSSGVYAIHVKPAGRARKMLREGKTLHVITTIVFTPAGTVEHIRAARAILVRTKRTR